MKTDLLNSNRLVLLGIVLAALLALVLIVSVRVTNASVQVPNCPVGTTPVWNGQIFVCVSDDTPDDGLCDFGRNPEKLWPDNPSGHPFERPFCDPTGLDIPPEALHPWDTPKYDQMYCDQVPGCWAYGLLPPA